MYMGCHCASKKRFLGDAATDQAILTSMCPGGVAKSPCGFSVDTSQVQTVFQNSISSRLLMWPPPTNTWANCSGVQAPSAGQTATKVAGAAAGIGTATASAIAASLGLALNAIPIIGTIASVAIGVIGTIFAHHAQAVQMQSTVLCTNVPLANQYLQQIDASLAAGTITAAQAKAAYASIQAQFTSALKSDPSYKKGDALDAYNTAMQLVINARTADLATMAAAAPGASGGIIGSIENALGLSDSSGSLWPWLLAGGAALLFL